MFWNRALRVFLVIVALYVAIRGISYFPLSNLPEAAKEFGFFFRISYGALLIILALAIVLIPTKGWYAQNETSQEQRTAWALGTIFASVCWLVMVAIFFLPYPLTPLENDILPALMAVLATGFYLKQTNVGQWSMADVINTIKLLALTIVAWFACSIGGSLVMYAVFSIPLFSSAFMTVDLLLISPH